MEVSSQSTYKKLLITQYMELWAASLSLFKQRPLAKTPCPSPDSSCPCAFERLRPSPHAPLSHETFLDKQRKHEFLAPSNHVFARRQATGLSELQLPERFSFQVMVHGLCAAADITLQALQDTRAKTL